MRRDAEHFEGDECLVPVQKRKSSHALVFGFGGKNNLRQLIMVQAYDALGMPVLRDDAERVLRRNFPESAHLKSLLSQLRR